MPTEYSDFVDEISRTTLYDETVDALQALADTEGRDRMERAFAEVSKPLRVAPPYGYTEIQDGVCIERLQGNQECHHQNRNDLRHAPLGRDHERMFTEDSKPVLYTMDVYSLSWEALSGLVDYCQDRKLTASASARNSSHFPSTTIEVEIRTQAQADKDDELPW